MVFAMSMRGGEHGDRGPLVCGGSLCQWDLGLELFKVEVVMSIRVEFEQCMGVTLSLSIKVFQRLQYLSICFINSIIIVIKLLG